MDFWANLQLQFSFRGQLLLFYCALLLCPPHIHLDLQIHFIYPCYFREGQTARGRASPSVGNYLVDVRSFEQLALPTIKVHQQYTLHMKRFVGKCEMLEARKAVEGRGGEGRGG